MYNFQTVLHVDVVRLCDLQCQLSQLVFGALIMKLGLSGVQGGFELLEAWVRSSGFRALTLKFVA